MPLGKYKTIPVFHLGVFRIDVHLFKIKICKNVCCWQGTARMSCLCTVNCRYDALSHLIGSFFKLQIVHSYLHLHFFPFMKSASGAFLLPLHILSYLKVSVYTVILLNPFHILLFFPVLFLFCGSYNYAKYAGEVFPCFPLLPNILNIWFISFCRFSFFRWFSLCFSF